MASPGSPPSVPVLVVTFRRPDATRRVLEAVRAARPSRVYAVSDGPRSPEEAARVEETRELFDALEPEIEVVRDFSSMNLGCAVRVATGIGRAFEEEERLVILEDDTVPSPDFFPYVMTLLDRYAEEPRVMAVQGTRLDDLEDLPEDPSYRFVRVANFWGWATWRRAWERFPKGHLQSKWFRWLEQQPRAGPLWRRLERLPSKLSRMAGGLGWPRVAANPALRERIRSCGRFQSQGMWRADLNRSPGWGFLWALTIQLHDGLVASPARNLVTNIGVGTEGTHPTSTGLELGDRPPEPLRFPLRHPLRVEIDQAYQRACASAIDRAMGDLVLPDVSF